MAQNKIAQFFAPRDMTVGSTTSAIVQFTVPLLIGNIGNFIFGVGTTRLMTKSLSGFKPLRKKWLFGGAAK